MHKSGYLVVSVALAALALLTGCGKKAKYEVKGTGTAAITYLDGSDAKTVKDATLPWSVEVRGTKFELTALGSGQLDCSIDVDGQGVMGVVGSHGTCITSSVAR